MKASRAALLGMVLGGLLGCHRPAVAPASRAGENVRHFETRGLVREVAADRSRAVIRHEEIPGYMPRMTMELIVRNAEELDGVSAGDEITFTLHATDETHWIDGIRRVGRATETTGAAQPLFVPKDLPELEPGDPMPDAEFLGEDGRPVKLSDYRGRALAFTFFFTRCPLPDYCPRMNTQFRDARAQLLEAAPAVTNWQFLCVSFDAEFDQPAVLAGYASAFRGSNRDRWRFAVATPETLAEVAPRLDLMVSREGASLSHNLRTVVLDPAGRVFRMFDGNTWTAEELAAAVLAAANQGSPLPASARAEVDAGTRTVPPALTRTNQVAPLRIASERIENLFLLGEGLYSGGEPQDEAAFAQLQQLGVKTILSVDGSRPDVAAAARHGIRYVHLPLGYDGYDSNACVRLSQAALTLPGPLFVHCHHGKHRGPAAAAIMAASLYAWLPATGLEWLRTAGTSTNYAGLYRTVAEFRAPNAALLRTSAVDLPAVASVSDMVEAMVQIDRNWDRLKLMAKSGFAPPPEHPDVVPAREAAQLAEHLESAAQLRESADHGAEFLRQLRTAAQAARDLSAALARPDREAETRATLQERSAQIEAGCTDCHRTYRNRRTTP